MYIYSNWIAIKRKITFTGRSVRRGPRSSCQGSQEVPNPMCPCAPPLVPLVSWTQALEPQSPPLHTSCPLSVSGTWLWSSSPHSHPRCLSEKVKVTTKVCCSPGPRWLAHSVFLFCSFELSPALQPAAVLGQQAVSLPLLNQIQCRCSKNISSVLGPPASILTPLSSILKCKCKSGTHKIWKHCLFLL